MSGWQSERLKWTVQALAMPADVQVTLFPDFVYKADALVLEWDERLHEAPMEDRGPAAVPLTLVLPKALPLEDQATMMNLAGLWQTQVFGWIFKNSEVVKTAIWTVCD